MKRWLPDLRARYCGRLEGLREGQLHGWASDRRDPQVRPTVCLTGSDGRQVELVADLYRADLHRTGIGDGHYGFSLPVSRLAGTPIVHARIKGARKFLPGSPFARADQNAAQRSVRDGMLVQIDEPSELNTLTGLVVDLVQTLRRPSLALRQHGRVIARDRATRFRPDVDILNCDALHGFRLIWSEQRRGHCELIDTRGDRLLGAVRIGR